MGEETERRVSLANGGPAVAGNARRESRTLRSKPTGSEMTFTDVCVDAAGKRILWSVSGKAVPGQMLAIMGPSGKSDNCATSLSQQLCFTPLTTNKRLIMS